VNPIESSRDDTRKSQERVNISMPRPSKHTSTQKQASQSLPIHCINSQNRAILASIHHPQPLLENEHDTNVLAAQQITSLLEGSVIRGEGNSCLLLGPRASGKSQVRRPFISSVFQEFTR
jgi:origin recognition complex subunit 4